MGIKKENSTPKKEICCLILCVIWFSLVCLKKYYFIIIKMKRYDKSNKIFKLRWRSMTSGKKLRKMVEFMQGWWRGGVYRIFEAVRVSVSGSTRNLHTVNLMFICKTSQKMLVYVGNGDLYIVVLWLGSKSRFLSAALYIIPYLFTRSFMLRD